MDIGLSLHRSECTRTDGYRRQAEIIDSVHRSVIHESIMSTFNACTTTNQPPFPIGPAYSLLLAVKARQERPINSFVVASVAAWMLPNMKLSIPWTVRRPVRRLANLCWLLLVVLKLLPTVHAKTKSGSFRLSGVRTERILGAFLMAPYGGPVTITLTADRMYEMESYVKIRAYRDTEIQAFRKEPLCTRKTLLAKHTVAVRFEPTNQGEDNNSKNPKNAGPKWEATVAFIIPESDSTGDVKRNYYWYFAMDDCSLEEFFHDDQVPTIQYKLSAQNYKNYRRANKTHLSATDMKMPELYAFTFVASGLIWCYLFFRVIWKVGVAARHEVHVAVLWVAGAVSCDCWESFMEIVHLYFYNKNGIGSYQADALSAYFAALSDAMVVVLLLSMAAGWTLGDAPTVSVVNPNPVQKYITSLARPSQSRGLIIVIFTYHLVLAQWGRMYDDDDDSYHHLEHLPGKVMIFSRTLMGLVFLGAVRQTKNKFPKLKVRANVVHVVCPPTTFSSV
jgi:Rhodopsin-like GPCR transmembrane domain